MAIIDNVAMSFYVHVFVYLICIIKCRITDNSMFNKLRNFPGYLQRLLHYFTFSRVIYEVSISYIYLSNFNTFYDKIRLTRQMSCLTHTFFSSTRCTITSSKFPNVRKSGIFTIKMRHYIIDWPRLSLR